MALRMALRRWHKGRRRCCAACVPGYAGDAARWIGAVQSAAARVEARAGRRLELAVGGGGADSGAGGDAAGTEPVGTACHAACEWAGNFVGWMAASSR